MRLFSLDNILLENSISSSNNVIDIDNIGYIDKEVSRYSFVQEGYNAILEMNAYYCNAEKEFYTKVMGSYGDDYIINESFSDFFNAIKNIIKKFIEFIKKIFQQFAAKLAALVNSDKYIKKNKNLLQKFESDDEFEFNGYNYTEIDTTNIPKNTAKDAFSIAASGATGNNAIISFEKYFKDADEGDYYKWTQSKASDGVSMSGWDLDDMDDSNFNADSKSIQINVEKNRRVEATKKINDAINKDIDALNDGNEEFYDTFRASVINKSGKLDSKEFTEELYKVFRNGEDSPKDITINYNFVQDAYRRFDKYKDVTKEIDKKKKEMIKDYEDLEKELDRYIEYSKTTHKMSARSSVGTRATAMGIGNISLGSGSNIVYDQSTADKLQSYLKVWSTRVNQMCQIHTQAFTAKLEAAKDCFNQDKKILNKAIQKVLKHKAD